MFTLQILIGFYYLVDEKPFAERSTLAANKHTRTNCFEQPTILLLGHLLLFVFEAIKRTRTRRMIYSCYSDIDSSYMQ